MELLDLLLNESLQEAFLDLRVEVLVVSEHGVDHLEGVRPHEACVAVTEHVGNEALDLVWVWVLLKTLHLDLALEEDHLEVRVRICRELFQLLCLLLNLLVLELAQVDCDPIVLGLLGQMEFRTECSTGLLE